MLGSQLIDNYTPCFGIISLLVRNQ
jgi:hypothetical protein